MTGATTHVLPSNTISLSQALRGQPVLAGYTVALIALLPALCLAYVIDDRTVLEHNVWLKPIKFDLAIAVYILTLSLYANLMPAAWRNSAWFNRTVQVIGLTIIAEMVWLIGASALGEPSHFNQTHPVLAPVYAIMGILATILTLLSAVVGLGVLRHNESSVPPILRYAIAYSLFATAVLTLITASYLASAPAQSHAVLPDGMTSLDNLDAVPIMGWLRQAGDLRVAHFFSTHALHGIPLVAYVWFALLPQKRAEEGRGAHTVAAALTAGYAALVIFLFMQALSGRPVI